VRVLAGVVGVMLLGACAGDAQFGEPEITVDVQGVDVEADTRTVVRAARDACVVGVGAVIADPPRAVRVTIRFPDGSDERVTLDCETGDIVDTGP
jgi:hypothetical protein